MMVYSLEQELWFPIIYEEVGARIYRVLNLVYNTGIDAT